MTIRFETDNFTLEEHRRAFAFTLVDRNTGECTFIEGDDAEFFETKLRTVETHDEAFRDLFLDELCLEVTS
jgi:hypothetical protein